MSALVERDQVAKIQDLSNEFVNADMKATPFTTAVKKGEAPTNAMLEYAVERFASPNIVGVVDEADPATFSDPSEGDAVLYARIQTFEEAVRIGGLATTTTHQAGITPRNVVAKKIAKKLMELKRSIEARFLGDDDSQVDNGTVGNETRGLGKWISSSAQSHYAVDSNYRTPSGSISTTAIASYNDATITDVFKSSYDQHGNGSASFDIFAGSTWKQGLDRITFYAKDDSGFTQVRNFNQAADAALVLGKVDVLETSFGTGIVRLSQFINTGGDHTSAASKRLAYLCPMDYVEARFSQNPISIPLAKTGRNEKFLVTATGALAVTNPLPFGKWVPSA